MGQKSKASRSTRRLTVGVISTAVGVIAVSIIVTLGFQGYIDLSFAGIGEPRKPASYRNITLTDAQLECEQEARDSFGERLRVLTVDSHSSRYDQQANRYKVFFKADVYAQQGKGNNITKPFLVNCYVHGSRGSITNFESFEDKEVTAKPSRKESGNIFGF